MTPKEKAKELFDKFYMAIPSDEMGLCDEASRLCALIAADELIKYHDEFMNAVRYNLPSNIVASIPYKYWDEVKQEIEKL